MPDHSSSHPVDGSISPISLNERIEVIDVLRGFAIFGILLVNMAFYSAPVYLYVTNLEWWPGILDRIASWLIRFFAEGKFYSLFSLMFGFGLAIQMGRAETRGISFLPLFVRRLTILLIIGLFHAFLIWPGDILVPYAIFGFFLLLFRNWMPKTLITWAFIFLLLPVLIMGVGVASLEMGRSIPEVAQQIDAQFAKQTAEYESLAYQSVKIYSEGSFSEIMEMRLKELGFMYFGLIFFGPNIFALFLVGLYIGRRGVFQDLGAHIQFIRSVFWWGLGLGIIANALFVFAREHSNPSIPSPFSFAFTAAVAVGAPSLCFFYTSAITRISQHAIWQKRMAPLAAVGRMAISNYLFQSVVCTMIFMNYGLGMYGKVGPALGLLLTVSIFIVQVILSRWWIKRYRFGPVEWLWRSLTYKKMQPMRLR